MLITYGSESSTTCGCLIGAILSNENVYMGYITLVISMIGFYAIDNIM